MQLRAFQKREFYPYGIAIAGDVESAAIGVSGALQFPF
jgi:hypothetical protein